MPWESEAAKMKLVTNNTKATYVFNFHFLALKVLSSPLKVVAFSYFVKAPNPSPFFPLFVSEANTGNQVSTGEAFFRHLFWSRSFSIII